MSAVGLGAMPLSIEGRPDRARAIATIQAALDAGVTLIDTADCYHRHAGEVGHNETLIAAALHDYGDRGTVLAATKGGRGRLPAAQTGSASAIRRLGGALRELLDAGLIRMAGVSNVDNVQIMEARAILGSALVSCRTSILPPSGIVRISWSPARS